MKKVRVKFKGNCKTGHAYKTTSFAMAWLKKVPVEERNNFDFEMCFDHSYSWHTCRETLANVLVRARRARKGTSEYEAIPRDRLRLILMRVGTKNDTKLASSFTAWISNGVRILNIFEKEVGWGLTTVSGVKNPELIEPGKCAIVVTASPKWMRATQLLSLFLLIIRSSKLLYVRSIKGVSDINVLSDKYKEVNSSGDASYVKRTAHAWLKVLQNADELFSSKENFPMYDGHFGISGLVAPRGGNCSEKMHNLWKEIDKR